MRDKADFASLPNQDSSTYPNSSRQYRTENALLRRGMIRTDYYYNQGLNHAQRHYAGIPILGGMNDSKTE